MNSRTVKKISDIPMNLDTAIHVLAFICMLLIGADKWSINVGVVLRIDQVFLCLLFLLILLRRSFIIPANNWVILFLVSSMISVVLAVDIFRSLLFYFSIIYNIVFIFYTFTNYILIYGYKNLINLFRKTCYVQFVLLLIQMALKAIFDYELPFLPGFGSYMGVLRFNLWFYEPSYLATYLVFWFMLSCYMLMMAGDKSYIKDVMMGLIMFLVSTATTGFIGIFLVVAIVYVIWPANLVKKVGAFMVILIIAAVIAVVFRSTIEQFVGRLFNGSLNDASGGRISQWKETWNVFFDNFFFGVGPGNYGRYFGKEDTYVPSNVTLDVLATLGIFGGITFFGFNITLIVKAFLVKTKTVGAGNYLLKATAWGLIIFLIILQANQGYLRLYHWMFLAFLQGALCEYKKPRKIKSKIARVIYGQR